jgi:hypothetical protein
MRSVVSGIQWVLLAATIAGCGQDEAASSLDENSGDSREPATVVLTDKGGGYSSSQNQSANTTVVVSDEENTGSAGEFEFDEPTSYCAEHFGCGVGDTCLEGFCEKPCFEESTCDAGETCRRTEDDSVECLAPWTCELDSKQTLSSEVGEVCSIVFNCSVDVGHQYELRCNSDRVCECVEDDKIVGSFSTPSKGEPLVFCGTSKGAISEMNSRCGWAILPSR